MNDKKMKLTPAYYATIGECLLGIDGGPLTISEIASVIGITRQTLAKLVADDLFLYEATKHISNAYISTLAGHTPDSRESRYFFRAQGYAKRVDAFRKALDKIDD